tara:strand:- start:146 stop:538 length:393 start_codon:yes stop_codon:yes gene_type:complete
MKNINKGYDFKVKSSFVTDLPFGEKYEGELKSILEGKIELKTDRLCQKTGNVFIETQSRGKDSGILTTTADYWAFCLWKENRGLKDQTYTLVSTKILKKLMTKYPKKAGGDNYTSKGHIMPKEELQNQTI